MELHVAKAMVQRIRHEAVTSWLFKVSRRVKIQMVVETAKKLPPHSAPDELLEVAINNWAGSPDLLCQYLLIPIPGIK